MIEVSNLSFKYPGQQEPVFTDFSLGLEQNKVYGLYGECGGTHLAQDKTPTLYN